MSFAAAAVARVSQLGYSIVSYRWQQGKDVLLVLVASNIEPNGILIDLMAHREREGQRIIAAIVRSHSHDIPRVPFYTNDESGISLSLCVLSLAVPQI